MISIILRNYDDGNEGGSLPSITLIPIMLINIVPLLISKGVVDVLIALALDNITN